MRLPSDRSARNCSSAALRNGAMRRVSSNGTVSDSAAVHPCSKLRRKGGYWRFFLKSHMRGEIKKRFQKILHMVISSGKQHERSNTHSKHQKIPWYASGMFLLERTRWTIWYCRDPRHHRMLQGAVRRAGGKSRKKSADKAAGGDNRQNSTSWRNGFRSPKRG